ncbi:MAG: O-antigen ligase family protein [Gemmatimonadaceae bacterium]
MTQRRGKNLASTVTLGFFFLVTLAGLVGGGRLIPLLYVLFAVIAGVVAYYREPTRYVAFVFGLWFFTPWVRRVIDLHNGFDPTNVVLLAPLLVTLIGALTLVARARELRGSMMSPFFFTLSAVLYGYAVGALKSGFIPATYAMLTWVAPITFSMHLMLSWRLFPRLRDSFLTFLQYALPIIAAYGIYQFVRPPSWDVAWMTAADVASVGSPIPFGFRSFGTLNTPGPYAVALLVGMLFLLGTTRRGLVLSLSLGLVALLLTRTRASWVAFVVGLLVVQFMGPVRRITRNWMILLLMVALAMPLLSLDVFRDTISKRLASFATLAQDQSVKQRLIISRGATEAISTHAEGEGLGATGGGTKLQEGGRTASIDNGFLEVFYVLGWPGGALLMLGLIGHILTLGRFRDARQDAFANSARACFWAMLSVLLIGDIFSGGIGTMFWGCYGFACCGHSYNFALGRGLRSRELARQLVPLQAAPRVVG